MLLSWIHIGSCYSKTKWDGEIANSLRNNLKGKCSIKEAVVKQYDINTPLEDNHSYFVQIRYPSEREQKHFHDLPLSLSRGNDEVPAMMERDNLGIEAITLMYAYPHIAPLYT
ncbi:hypothetical protein EON63_01340 [archaeon]|nr:MAG: hypothetical protein EON63_01340 [archaeon]